MAHTPPPLDSGRHPFELFVLLLGLVAGLPLIWGAPAPSSTTALLGPAAARIWGVMFAGGCAVALVGVLWAWPGWPGRWRFRPQPGTGLLLEQVGLVGLGASTIIYTVGITASDGPPGRYVAVGLILALGLACVRRVWQIQRWVQAAIHDQQGR